MKVVATKYTSDPQNTQNGIMDAESKQQMAINITKATMQLNKIKRFFSMYFISWPPNRM
jgi:hypothetical protein